MSDQWVWGIDLSTTYVDLAVVDRRGAFQHVPAQLLKVDGNLPSRLVQHTQYLTTFFAAMASHFPPLTVYVELPTGVHPSPPLMMECGVVLQALQLGVQQFAHPVGIHTCSVTSWKKKSTGKGNAPKSLVLEWARLRGYTGERQDGADALGVANFACWEVQRPLPIAPYSPAHAVGS